MGAVKFSPGAGSTSAGLNVTSRWDHLFPEESNTLGFSGSFIMFHILPFTSSKFQSFFLLPLQTCFPWSHSSQHQQEGALENNSWCFWQSNSVDSVKNNRLMSSASARFLFLTLRSHFHVSKFYSQSPEYLGAGVRGVRVREQVAWMP